MNHKISKAIFPIAGLGTRFLPATKSVPKEMLTILDRPIIEWAVIEAAKSGIDEMIFVTSSRKNIVLEHFEKSELLEFNLKKKKKLDKIKLIESQNRLGKFSLVIQDEPKGLGHAVCCASNFFDKDQSFAVILPDDLIMSKTPAIKQLIEIYKKTNGGSVIGLEKVPMNKVSNYGVIEYKKKIKTFSQYQLLLKNQIKVKHLQICQLLEDIYLTQKFFNFSNLEKKDLEMKFN